MQTVAYYTIGCKLNFSETSTISRQLSDAGYEKVAFENKADVYIINTCSVTDNADKKCKKIINEALRHNPKAFIAIIGCYAQLKPELISKISGVDIVIGTEEKFNILNYISDTSKKEKAVIIEGRIQEVHDYHSSYSIGDRTRSFLKVQDGCDYFCTFCTIPLARGESRSDAIDHVVKQAKEIVQSGVKEIVLTGVNTGDFGKNNNETFFKLLQELENVSGILRIRISSIEPNLLTDEIIDAVSKSKIIVPHFHIPLQSGSDKILKLMKRKYESALYKSRIEKIKKLIPHCCIGADVIVGFPGETHEDFLETYKFLNALDVSYLHVFSYSQRQNTSAYKMPDKVHHAVISERSKQLHSLSDKKRRFFYNQHLGKVHKILWEAESDGNTMFGFTENYIKTKTTYDPILVNEISESELLSIDSEMVVNTKLKSLVDFGL